ncbi:hypothetical protein JCM18899A_55400 [Nocardioides sp. AN3]
MIVVLCPEEAEQTLLAGKMRCPGCGGRLGPHGHGRPRTVRGLGATTLRVQPRRARCADCRATQVLLPSTLAVRRADSTEVIGAALLAQAHGAGHRTIARQLGRPPSTVRRWLRRVTGEHAKWLWQRGVERAAIIDRELLSVHAGPTVVPAQQHSPLWHALNLLGTVARRYRQLFAANLTPWPVIGFFARGWLLAPAQLN